jgi:hypothetical protein
MKFLIIWTLLIGCLAFLLSLDAHPHAGYLAQVGMVYLWLIGSGIYLFYRVIKYVLRSDSADEKYFGIPISDEELRSASLNEASTIMGETLPFNEYLVSYDLLKDELKELILSGRLKSTMLNNCLFVENQRVNK